MLQLKIPLGYEEWDEETNTFIEPEYQVLELEHSLVSISKWESKWHKSFLNSKNKTDEETLDYIKCMVVNENVDPEIYDRLTIDNVTEIRKYIDNPMTATTFSEDRNGGKSNREVITSELIYFWMIAHNIPSEYQHWHLNRLITLIRVCDIKNNPPKKRSKRDIMSQNAALNAARRAQMNTKG